MVDESLEAIRTREDFQRFMQLPLVDLENNGTDWENRDLGSYLKAHRRRTRTWCSGQAWKLLVFFAGGTTMLLGLYTALFSSVSLSETSKIAVLPGSLILGIGSIVFLALALVCPRCRARWVWLLARHGSGPDVSPG